MTQELTRHALRVTAALSELRTAHGDVLDALIPFFEPILTLMSGKIFDPGLLAAGVQRLYRWRFTRDVAEQFIPRLERKGYLRRQGLGKEALYVVVFAGEHPPPGANEFFLGILSRIVDEYERFQLNVSELRNYTRSREELEDILIRFLVSIDAFGEGTLEGIATGADDPINDHLLASLSEGGRPLSTEDHYIAARFVADLCQRDPGQIADLTKIAAVGLLTEVVEDFIRPTDTATDVELTIVLDAPVALDYLGLSGAAFQSDVRSVFDPLRRIGCKFVVFPITGEEMQRNIQSMLALSPADRHGYTHQAMVRGEVMGDYVQAVADNPERALEAAGIGVRSMNLGRRPINGILESVEC